MSDPNSPEARADLEADEVRLWVGVTATGLWCPTCLLPSGYRISVQRDPAEQATTGVYRCATDETHRVEES